MVNLKNYLQILSYLNVIQYIIKRKIFNFNEVSREGKYEK